MENGEDILQILPFHDKWFYFRCFLFPIALWHLSAAHTNAKLEMHDTKLYIQMHKLNNTIWRHSTRKETLSAPMIAACWRHFSNSTTTFRKIPCKTSFKKVSPNINRSEKKKNFYNSNCCSKNYENRNLNNEQS